MNSRYFLVMHVHTASKASQALISVYICTRQASRAEHLHYVYLVLVLKNRAAG